MRRWKSREYACAHLEFELLFFPSAGSRGSPLSHSTRQLPEKIERQQLRCLFHSVFSRSRRIAVYVCVHLSSLLFFLLSVCPANWVLTLCDNCNCWLCIFSPVIYSSVSVCASQYLSSLSLSFPRSLVSSSSQWSVDKCKENATCSRYVITLVSRYTEFAQFSLLSLVTWYYEYHFCHMTFKTLIIDRFLYLTMLNRSLRVFCNLCSTSVHCTLPVLTFAHTKKRITTSI